MNPDQGMNSQFFETGKFVKQSSRKGRKPIVVKIAVTVNMYQDKNSQFLKMSQLVKQSSRKRSKLIVIDMSKQ